MAKNKKNRSLYELYKEEQEKLAPTKSTHATGTRSLRELYNAENGITETEENSALKWRNDEIAPVRDTKKEEKQKWYEGWTQKGGLSALDDGFQLSDIGDIFKTSLATTADLKANLGGGILEMGEGAVDALAYLGGVGAKMAGQHKLANATKDFIADDLYDGEKIASYIISPENWALKAMGEDYDELSTQGEKLDSLVQSGGQLLGTVGLQAVGVPWFLTTGVTSFGGGVEEAFDEGADYTEAGLSAAITAGADILTEKLFGGSGLGEKGLINLDGLTKGIANKAVKALVDYGIDVTAEGFEEVGAGILSNLGSALYKEENLKEILWNEDAVDEYIESFIGGAVLGGGMNATKVGKSVKQGTDYRTGLTANEQKVFDKAYDDAVGEAEKGGKKLSKNEKAKIYDNVMEKLQKGYISTDVIEEVMDGKTFGEYKSLTEQEKALTDEISQLENIPKEQITVKQSERLSAAREELKNLTNKDELKSRLTDGVKSQIDAESKKLKDRGSYLAESYNEIERKGQAFKVDLSKYKGIQRNAYERAMNSGVLNDTNRSHEFVDTLAKIEADKGIVFDYTNNAKLKESGFALDGKTVNAYVTNSTVTLNMQSSKAWQSTVGHEVTHILEGTESYGELRQALFAYAESKGELASRKAALTELYKGVDADIDAELTADLVGDYLFNDGDFIKNLTTNKTVFQKIYDEIKYLCKVATGKEKADIEKVKREFDKVWESFSAEDVATENNDKVKLSVSETTDGSIVAVVDNDILNNIDTTSWDDTKKETAKEAASNALKQFSDGIVVDGITRKVNRTSRREYTRSAYTESLYKNAPDVFADKMRAADIADDIVVATTNWNRDGSLKHPRNDNFVDFDHGTTLIMSGDAKYKAEVVVGITKNGDAVLYDVVDMTPTTFDIKKAETSTTATTQNAIGDINEISATDILSQTNADVKTEYSVSPESIENDATNSELFTDIEGKERKLFKHDNLGYRVMNTRKNNSYFPSAQEAINAENENIKSFYAKKLGVKKSYIDRMVKEDKQFLAKLSSKNEDVRFSLSNEVETTKNLVALHNLTENKLSKVMDLGGFPMPSIAVTRTDIPHTNFGDITLVMNKSTIDPKANRKNTVYSADAWTPTVPPTEYKPNDNRLREISNKVYGLVGDRNIVNALDYVAFDTDNVSRDLDQTDGNLAKKYTNNNTLKYAFLKDIGANIEMSMKDAPLSRGVSNEAVRYFSGKLVNGLQTVEHYQNMSATEMMNDKELTNAVAEALNWDVLRQFEEGTENYDKLKANPLYQADDLSLSQIDSLLNGVRKYFNHGIEQTVDGRETKNTISNYFNENNLQEQYENWLNEMFEGVVEKTGIYNNKDIFTPSGNRRTFEQLHLPVTLDNIVKAMASQNNGNTKNVAGFNGVKTLRAGMAERFKSIDDMHKLEGRLQNLTAEEFDAIHDQLSERMHNIINRILETAPESSGNIYMRMDSIGETLMEIAESGKYNTDAILKTVNQYIYNIDENLANDIRTLLYDVSQMPTNMFEAKPERAVGFDEVNAAILPDNADNALRERLESMGVQVLTYEKGNDTDRLNKLNSLLEEQPDWKFSLSKQGEQPSSIGTPLKELSLAPTEDDIAPTPETVAENTTVDDDFEAPMPTDADAPFPDKISPMTEEEANAVQAEKAQADANAEGQPKTRKQLHSNIINDVKATFSSSGFDFDDVLESAKNLSTFATVDNTPQRVMEKALGYKEGQVLADLTVNKVAQNETKGVKWLNSFTDRKNGLLAQISKQYNIKPGSKESAAAQMYAEGFYVNDNNDIVAYGDAELAQDFPDVNVRNNIKGLASDQRIRQIYDETLNAINASRTRNAYPEIQRLDNYFLHFRAMEDTFSRLGLPFNPNDIRAKDLPTDLNGVTADLKPGQPYFASAMHRKGKRTSFDLLGGLERYLTSAKNQIYHIDDIQTLRALRNYIADTYGQANGLEGIDMLTEEEAQERIEQVFGSHLSTFAKFLNEEANVLAGKTALIDRGLEGIIGRRGMTFFDTVNKQVGSNMVGFNISSSLTNFIPVAQTFAKTNKFDFLKAFTQTVSNKFGSIYGKGDDFAENSPVIIRRKGADRFYRTPFQKAGDAGYALMSAVDDISTELIARTKYNELTRKGMDEQQAHFETDKWVSRLMGDRSLGQQPQLYNSKMLGIVTKFQLEVRNQLDSQFYDTIQEAKVSNEEVENALARNAKTAAKVTATFVQLAVAQHLFGKAFESVAGYNPAFDIISVLATMFGFDDDEESEDTVLDNVVQGFLELSGDLPYTSTLTGGRIPISNALPITELIQGKDSYGNEKSRWETFKEAVPYYALPGGYGQIKKTAQGLGMFNIDEDHPIAGSYTNSGNLRFPVEDTLANRIQAGIFGQYASDNAREYFDNGYAPLKEKQIQEYMDVDLPIADYWDYRDGLKGLKKNAEKADYINSLDIEDWQKNLLMNNILDRKEDVDMSNYDDYSSFEEFDYAQKNPEKYEFFMSNGISYKDYANADEDGKAAYTWAYNNPEKYTLSKAVTDDVIKYKQYTGEMYDIKADKDANGKSISGSRKEKVINYINNLDADYETKIILFKTEYPSDDTYNTDIINYLNNRDDLTYEERLTIFTELGFTVKDGYVYWD